jgi:AcrR family transcriptional regulator
MCPKHLTFDNHSVLQAAIDVVRQAGLEALSARSVAKHLKSSVAPVYYSFRSMERLKEGVLDEARRLLEERAGQSYTDIRFLNIGVGVVLFGRDEGQLFRALFLYQGEDEGISSAFFASARTRMKEDTLLRRLPELSLKQLWDSFWFYAMGLAMGVIFGQMLDKTDENIVRLLKNTANTLIFASVAGIADSESAENAREWSRLLLEKRIILPPEG